LKVFASTVIAAISSAAETLLSGLEEDIRCGGNEGPQWAVRYHHSQEQTSTWCALMLARR
jgi:hypothetical protein